MVYWRIILDYLQSIEAEFVFMKLKPKITIADHFSDLEDQAN
jgi:hypothetical protein